MARLIQQLVASNKLMKQPLGLVNRAGNSGAEGLLEVKAARGNPHKLIITLSNLFTTPLATGTGFNWRDLTPVQISRSTSSCSGPTRLRRRSPLRTCSTRCTATGSGARCASAAPAAKQEDQLLSVLLETAAATRIAYVPLKGGGGVAKALAAAEVDLTVNNPIEAEKLWREGKVRPLCVFDSQKLDYPTKIAGGMGGTICRPACRSASPCST